ncbi:hypothetical protein LA080_005753 [Diaporthe eres]|nr:hypothetical protein LA080_005753 [Diaporthe eres]
MLSCPKTSASPLQAASEGAAFGRGLWARPRSKIRLLSTDLDIKSFQGPSFSELPKDQPQGPSPRPQAPGSGSGSSSSSSSWPWPWPAGLQQPGTEFK